MSKLNTYTTFLLTVFFTAAFSFYGFAQCSPDNSKTEFGAYSSSGKNKMPTAWVDSSFNEVITLVVPAEISGFKIIEVTLKDAPNLYTGLNYTCNPSSCLFTGGNNGCITISGTPTDKNQANQQLVDLKLYIVTDVVPFDTTIAIEFDLLDSSSLGVNPAEKADFTIFPNPTNNAFYLTLPNGFTTEVPIEISNLSGELVQRLPIEKNNQEPIEISTSNWENGVYFLKMEHNNAVLIRKIVVQH